MIDPPPLGLGYVLSRFPLLSETFILRELVELERQGWQPAIFALQHQRDAVRHPEAARLEPRVQFLQPVAPRTWRATLDLLRHQPALLTHLLRLTIGGNLASPDFLLKGLALLPGTLELTNRMRRAGVRHLHAHYGTHPALVALLASELLGISYSFTVHAHDLFVDTTMLAEKVRRARFVVTISDYNRRRLLDLCGPAAAEKIHLVRCGVEPVKAGVESITAASPLPNPPPLGAGAGASLNPVATRNNSRPQRGRVGGGGVLAAAPANYCQQFRQQHQ